MSRAIYREDGGKWIVDVISDSKSGDKRCVEFRCVEQVRPSPISGSIKPGEEHVVTCVDGFEAYVGWSLEVCQ